MGLLLPALAIGAILLLGGKKPSSKQNNGTGEPAVGDNTAPSNVTFGPLGAFSYGARIYMGDDVTDEEVGQIQDIVYDHAREYSALPFQITMKDGPGIDVVVIADGMPYEEWAEDVTYLDPYLRDMLIEHIPG